MDVLGYKLTSLLSFKPWIEQYLTHVSAVTKGSCWHGRWVNRQICSRYPEGHYMDQAILNSCKRRYKRKLLAHTILEDESIDKSVPEILKAITWIKQYLSRKSRYKRKLLTHTILDRQVCSRNPEGHYNTRCGLHDNSSIGRSKRR